MTPDPTGHPLDPIREIADDMEADRRAKASDLGNTPTLRECMVAKGEIQDQSWEDWAAKLVAAVGDRYGPRGALDECGEESWRGYYDDGYSAEDAAAEDLSYADDDE